MFCRSERYFAPADRCFGHRRPSFFSCEISDGTLFGSEGISIGCIVSMFTRVMNLPFLSYRCVSRGMIADPPDKNVTATSNPAHSLRFGVQLGPGFLKFFRLIVKSTLNRCGFVESLLYRIASNVFRYPHAAKMRAAHGAKMCGLCSLSRQRLVMKLTSRFRV